MAVTISTMAIKLRAQSDKLKGDIREAKRTLGELGGATARLNGGMTAAAHHLRRAGDEMRAVGQVARTLAMSLAALGAAVAFLGRFTAQIESARLTLRMLIGDAEEAERVFGRIVDFASLTPFELPQLMQATKQLLVYGTAVDDIIPSLKMLGDVSAGVGADIGEVAFVVGTMKDENVALRRDLVQLSTRGIPIFRELQNIVGKTGEEFAKFVSDRKVDFALVMQAFRNMTSEGGLFYNAMLEQSKTLGGVMSTLKDEFQLTAAALGQQLLPLMKGLAAITMQLLDSLKQVSGEQVKSLVKWLAMAAAFATAISLIPKLVRGFVAIVNAYRAMAKAQATVLALQGVKGIALLAAGLAAAAGAAYVVDRAFNQMTQAAQAYDEQVNERFGDQFAKMTAGFTDQAAAMTENVEAFEKASQRIEQLKSAGEQLTQSMRTPFEVAKDRVSELNELLAGQFITLETYRRAVSQVGEEYSKATDAAKELKQAQGTGIATRKSGGFSAIQEQKRHLQFLADKKKEELRLAEKRNELLVEIGVKLDGLSRGGQRINVQQVRL